MAIADIVLACSVVGISDGDTLTDRCDTPTGVESIKVRLAEIDAPEKAQPFGNRSKQHLSDLCFQKQAVVRPHTKDRYGRTVDHVACDGTDAGTGQVRAGMAWVFDRYVVDRGLYLLQDEARIAARGLWADTEPVAQWDWRAQSR